MKKTEILSQQEINEALTNLPGWEQKGDKISKQFEFADFMNALNFIVLLSPFFEEMDHHPDIHIFYNKILFELQRFDVGGKITNKDIDMAYHIEKSAGGWKEKDKA